MQTGTKATLYLGAAVNGEHFVDAVMFRDFLGEYVTPRFTGFTIRDTLGYWNGKPEVSRELIVIADGPLLKPFTDQVEAIARDYKCKFNQEAVMITYEPLRVEWDVPAKREPAAVEGWTSRDGDPGTDSLVRPSPFAPDAEGLDYAEDFHPAKYDGLTLADM